jgi:hypothetical protein
MINQPTDQIFVLKSDGVASRVVGNELIVLELSSSTYLTLNGTARDLWEALVDGATIIELSEMLVNRYDVSADLARTDANSFVSSLLERGLLRAGS